MTHSFATLFSAELEGVRAKLIEIETDLHAGLHSFHIVGLADKALNEAKERVSSAIKNSGAKPPNRENRKITVNLAPADIRKTGSHYDLAIALGFLRATGQASDFDPQKKLFVGELALDGRLRPVRGALNIAELARDRGFTHLFVPEANAGEASVISGVRVVPLRSLHEALAILEGKSELCEPETLSHERVDSFIPDLSEVKGQASAKRAIEIAAAGGHNVLMVGPPGVGKSLLAKAMGGILPVLQKEEAIEVTKIWSAAGLSRGRLITERPFRSPHQTSSLVSVVGGGTEVRPGEISLAHRGVLFLDELPEFPRNILEALRAPMESGEVHIARARHTLSFPARFTLVAAMNPCPCGFYGEPDAECRCAAYDVIRYQKKISGPLLDRIDLQLKVDRVPIENLRTDLARPPESENVRERVAHARLIQAQRPLKAGLSTNSEMSSREIETHASLDASGERFLSSLHQSRLSPRAYYRLIKVARTIADMEGSIKTTDAHLAEAFSYRIRES